MRSSLASVCSSEITKRTLRLRSAHSVLTTSRVLDSLETSCSRVISATSSDVRFRQLCDSSRSCSRDRKGIDCSSSSGESSGACSSSRCSTELGSSLAPRALLTREC